MPEISRFLGIIISMYYSDHGIPHFHVEYNNFEASISINDIALLENWKLVKEKQKLKKIKPLV